MSERDFAFGHALLRETPESVFEQQPMRSACGRYVMVFDGRIDNRDELFAEIGDDGLTSPNGRCDAALALAVFERLGDQMPSRLLGDFALAIWDSQSDSVLLTRDHVGGRPLYFVQTSDYFAFASGDQALLALPGVTQDPNFELIVHQYAPPLPEQSGSLSGWYRDVMRFPFGSVGRLSTASWGLEIERYKPWLPPSMPTVKDFEQAVDVAQELLRLSSQARMRPGETAALFMSGGIDSASVISSMRKVAPLDSQASKIVSLSLMESPVAECVESRCIASLATHYATTPETITPTEFAGNPLFAAVEREVVRSPHPQDNSILTFFPLFERARALGLRNVLSGIGGDLVADRSQSAIAEEWRQAGLTHAISLARAFASNNTYFRGASPIKLVSRALRQRFASALPEKLKRPLRTISTRKAFEPNAYVVRSNLLSKLERVSASRITPHATPKEAEQCDRAEVELRRTLRLVGEGQDLLQHLSSRYGIVVSDVWSDLRLIYFFQNLPPAITCKDGWTKAVVRAVLERDGLSDEVTRRKGKEHVGGNLIPALSASICRELDSVCGSKAELDWIDFRSIQSVLGQNHDMEAGGHGDAADALAAASLAIWQTRGRADDHTATRSVDILRDARDKLDAKFSAQSEHILRGIGRDQNDRS